MIYQGWLKVLRLVESVLVANLLLCWYLGWVRMKKALTDAEPLGVPHHQLRFSVPDAARPASVSS
jgi:hypothetical protein